MRFFRTFLVSLLGVSALYASCITIVNPRGDFAGTRFPWLAANTRKRKVTLFERYSRERPVKIVLLGSSRTMLLDPQLVESLSGLRAFNFGLFSAAPEDYLAVYRWLRRTHALPHIILAGVDEGRLGSGPAAAEKLRDNRVLAAELDPALRRPLGAATHELRLYKQAMTVAYARDVIHSVALKLRPKVPGNRFRPDGTMEYPAWDQAIAAGTFDRTPVWETCAVSAVNDLSSSTHEPVSSASLGQLNALIDEAHADGVTVVLWTTPVPPSLATRLAANPDVRRRSVDARARLAALVERSRVPFLDLTNPATFDGDPERWYDCQHYHRADADKIVRRLVAALPLDSTSLR